MDSPPKPLPLETEEQPCTAVLFDEQTEESLIAAVEKSRAISFDSVFIRKHAETFDVPRFVESIRETVSKLYERHAELIRDEADR